MATISKFYFHDTTTTNTGTMPSNSPTTQAGGVLGAGSEATGASTARATSDVIGAANPDTKSVITAAATSAVVQRLGHRRFVTAPLAARTYVTGDGNWTWSYANLESNTNHSGQLFMSAYGWRPSTGAVIGTVQNFTGNVMASTSEVAVSKTTTFSGITLLDGDIFVFDIYSSFNQGMAVAYTDSFCYDGTTEASITTCGSFISPPVALTLFTATAHSLVAEHPSRRRHTLHRRAAASFDRW